MSRGAISQAARWERVRSRFDQANSAAAIGVWRHAARTVVASLRQLSGDNDRDEQGPRPQSLRQRPGATAVVFIGADVGDEDAFATLTGPDGGGDTKVGDGPTVAKYPGADIAGCCPGSGGDRQKRAAWVAGADATPIENHSLLCDQRTCALVTPCGRICWMCLPRIDSPALFAELLGGASAGFFEICPLLSIGPDARQQYVGSTFVLRRTHWGTLHVTDYLDCSAGRPFQRGKDIAAAATTSLPEHAGGVRNGLSLLLRDAAMAATALARARPRRDRR